MSIAIPSKTLTATGGSPQAYMQFARADNSIALTLSIGSLNLASGGPAIHFAWAYSFAPYKATLSGANVTQHRLIFSGLVNGAWTALGPVAAGTYWITGLNISAFSYNMLSGAISLTVAAGAFESSLVNAAADTDDGTGVPRLHVVSAGDGRTIAKLRYKFVQSVASAGAWSGVVVGAKMYQLPTPPGD